MYIRWIQTYKKKKQPDRMGKQMNLLQINVVLNCITKYDTAETKHIGENKFTKKVP